MANKNTYLQKQLIKLYKSSLISNFQYDSNIIDLNRFNTLQSNFNQNNMNMKKFSTSNKVKTSNDKKSYNFIYNRKFIQFSSLNNKNDNQIKDSQLNNSVNSRIEMFNITNNDLNYDIKNIEKIGSKSKKDLQPAFTISNPEINTKYVPDAVKNYSLRIVNTSEIDEIHHDEEIKGKYYKYGLPIKNEIYKPHQAYLQELKENEKEKALTATENIMELFELDKNSSYESLVLKYNQNFNNGKLNNFYYNKISIKLF